MQLVFVDKRVKGESTSVKVSGDCSLFDVDEIFVRERLLESIQGYGLTDMDRARKKLVSELLTENVNLSIQVSLWLNKFRDFRRFEIIVGPGHCNKQRCSVFKSLFLKFKENVKISVYLSGTTGDVNDYVYVEGTKITGESFTSGGTASNEIPQSFRFDGHRKMRVKVVAEIADSAVKGATFAQKILEKGSFSNVVITAGNGAEIMAHKCFLSVSSPVLEAMLGSGMEESQTGRVDMSDLSEEGVRAFLRYVYYGDLTGLKENVPLGYELFYAGHKYDVPGLAAEMRTFLVETKNEDVGVGLAFKIYMFTRNIESAIAMELKTKAIQVLKANADELDKLQEYNDLFEKPSNSKIAKELCKDLAKTASD